jgi:hypothetical protein
VTETLLLLERLERLGEGRVAAWVRVAGHPCRLVVQPGPAGLRYVEYPFLLDAHPPSTRAVLARIGAWLRGEEVALPQDLSAEAQGSPFQALLGPRARERALRPIEGAPPALVSASRLPQDPDFLQVILRLEGREIDLLGRVFDSPGAVPLVIWHRGPPDDLDEDQQLAVEQAMVRAARATPR